MTEEMMVKTRETYRRADEVAARPGETTRRQVAQIRQSYEFMRSGGTQKMGGIRQIGDKLVEVRTFAFLFWDLCNKLT